MLSLVNTLIKYLRLVTPAVESIVKDKLPEQFGFILDGGLKPQSFVCCAPPRLRQWLVYVDFNVESVLFVTDLFKGLLKDTQFIKTKRRI